MDTVTMLRTDQEVPHTVEYEDEPLREETQEVTAHGMDNAHLDTASNDYCVDMVPLHEIDVESAQHGDDPDHALVRGGVLQDPIAVGAATWLLTSIATMR